MTATRHVTTRAELVEAAGNPACGEILVSEDVDDLPTQRLVPGQVLRGTGNPTLRFMSHGPSAIGFVNFGDLRKLSVGAAIETFGTGARGFAVYDGSLGAAEIDRIDTRGDGAVGIQISRAIGEIRVRQGIHAFGGTGDSLVKGVMTRLAAVPFSVKPGGSARLIVVEVGLTSYGEGVEPVELHGRIDEFRISAGIGPSGGSGAQ